MTDDDPGTAHELTIFREEAEPPPGPPNAHADRAARLVSLLLLDPQRFAGEVGAELVALWDVLEMAHARIDHALNADALARDSFAGAAARDALGQLRTFLSPLTGANTLAGVLAGAWLSAIGRGLDR